jgi:hypothetical protein
MAMFLVWQGRGLLAIIGFITTLASCAGLIEVNPIATFVAISFGLIVSGLICRHFARVWNKPEVVHSLYGISLKYWGKIYLWIGGAIGALIVGLFVTASVYRVVKGMPLDPMFGVKGHPWFE